MHLRRIQPRRSIALAPALAVPSLALLAALLLSCVALLWAVTARADDWSRHSHSHTSENSFSYDDSPGFAWVYLQKSGDDESLSGSGDRVDFEEARRLRDQANSDVLWVRLENDRYLIRDRGLLARARTAIEPVERLGREQGELGRQQGALGRRQGELGREQGQLGREQGRLAARQAQIAVRRARATARGDADDSYDGDDRDLERQMARLADRQDELSRRQSELAKEQEPLARRQGELGEQQGKASEELRRELRKIVDEAVRSGKAERLE